MNDAKADKAGVSVQVRLSNEKNLASKDEVSSGMPRLLEQATGIMHSHATAPVKCGQGVWPCEGHETPHTHTHTHTHTLGRPSRG